MIHLEQISENLIRGKISELQLSGKVVKAILSFIDPFVSLAASLMNEVCGAKISVGALSVMEDKSLTRVALERNASTPKFLIYQPTNDYPQGHQVDFPVIVKSTISKASKDVYRVENRIEMKKVLRQLTRLNPNKNILVEEYLEGPQYLVEAIVHEGNVKIVAVFKQHITKQLKFIVTGYEIQLDMEKEFYDRIYRTVTAILKDLKTINAAVHLEMRFVNGNWKLIEINPRLSGGAMNRMIEEAYGINLAEETIKLYMGSEPLLIRKFEKYIYGHFITIDTCGILLKVTGEANATQLPGVKDVFVKTRIGEAVMPALSMGHRYGYVIATGNSSEEARVNAINAAKTINFYVEPI